MSELYFVQRKVNGEWQNTPNCAFPAERAYLHMSLGRQDYDGGEWRLTPAGPRQPRDEREAEHLSNLEVVSRHMRPATRDEYRNWLSLYRARGRRPRNHRHLTFATANYRVHYYVATNSFEMKPFCGANLPTNASA